MKIAMKYINRTLFIVNAVSTISMIVFTSVYIALKLKGPFLWVAYCLCFLTSSVIFFKRSRSNSSYKKNHFMLLGLLELMHLGFIYIAAATFWKYGYLGIVNRYGVLSFWFLVHQFVVSCVDFFLLNK